MNGTCGSLSYRILLGVLSASILAACSPNSSAVNEISTVNTGSVEAESQYGALSSTQSVKGAEVYVVSETIRMRKSPEATEDNLAGQLVMNDVVRIVDGNRIGSDEFIRVRVIRTMNSDLKDKTLYTSAKYLDVNPATRLSKSAVEETGSSHFLITNVATEMVRLYRRCSAPEACINKMLMEFHATVGNDSKGMRSDVGVYKTTSWTKFYEIPGVYPGWYRENYPPLPKIGSRKGWLSKQAKPPGFSGPRGAFGWYTVFVGPNNNGQWTHGTTGWGADKEKLVRFQDSFMGGIVDMFAALGSHGCTRMSNEAIAYLRSNLPVGSTFIKIYAKESVKDPTLPGYSRERGSFDYILTNRGAGQLNTRHDLADRASVLASGAPESTWMEQGTFSFDQTPSAMSGDHYGVGGMSGVFNVDEGTLSSDYRHPVNKKLAVAGYPGRESALPSYVRESAPRP